MSLYQKYIVQKADSSAVDPNAKYYVLRYDADGSDAANAISALYSYADCIEDENPKLYRDLQVALGGEVAALCRKNTE